MPLQGDSGKAAVVEVDVASSNGAKPAPRPGGHLPYSVGAVAWAPKEHLDLAQWADVGRRLGTMGRCSQWWVGDWVRYGVSKWGEKYKAASRITGYDGHSLRNMAYVASRFDLSRRRDNLSFSHHAEVSALGPEEQDYWLELACSQRLSVGDLRVELRAANRRGRRALGPGEEGPGAGTEIVAVCPDCKCSFPVPLPRRPRI